VPVYVVVLIAAMVLCCTVLAIVVYRRQNNHSVGDIKDGHNFVGNAFRPPSSFGGYYYNDNTNTTDNDPYYATPAEPDQNTEFDFDDADLRLGSTRLRPAPAEYNLATNTEPQYALAKPVPPQRLSTTHQQLNPLYNSDPDDAVEMYMDVYDDNDHSSATLKSTQSQPRSTRVTVNTQKTHRPQPSSTRVTPPSANAHTSTQKQPKSHQPQPSSTRVTSPRPSTTTQHSVEEERDTSGHIYLRPVPAINITHSSDDSSDVDDSGIVYTTPVAMGSTASTNTQASIYAVPVKARVRSHNAAKDDDTVYVLPCHDNSDLSTNTARTMYDTLPPSGETNNPDVGATYDNAASF
jgi:hypothetical protein